MIDGWEIKTLGDISVMMADGPFGSNLKKEHYTENREVRIIQLSNIGEDGWREENTKYTTFKHLETIQRSEVFPNDIVIAKMMPAGRAIICPNHEKKFVLSSDAVKVQLKKGINLRFAWYSINSPYFRKQVYENVAGSGRVRTSLTKLKACKLRLPSLPEQQRIVDILDREFSKIDALKANAEKSLQAAKDLFQATLEKELEPKEGWQMDVLETLCECITKGTTPTSIGYSFTECGVNFVKAETFTEYGEILNDKIAHISIECNNALERSKLKELDLLFSIAGVLGRVAIVSKDILPANTNQALAIIRLKEPERMLVKYLFRYFKSPLVLKQIEKDKKGSAQYNLSLAQIKKIPVCIPPQDELEQIVYRLDDINDKCSSLQQNYQKTLTLCDDLKQALLRKAFNGEL